MSLKAFVVQNLKRIATIQYFLWINNLYVHSCHIHSISKIAFLIKNFKKTAVVRSKNPFKQICLLLSKLDIAPCDNASFFYSIDCFKTINMLGPKFDNYMIDYSIILDNSIAELSDLDIVPPFLQAEKQIVNSLKGYLIRCRNNKWAERYSLQFDAINSLFDRSSESFFEALQRILFVNQIIWQTRHTLNGLGRLDKILGNLYEEDIKSGLLTREKAKMLLKDFFKALHEYYWFKSNSLMGDTGQIIILGGKEPDGSYFCNDLTYLFIEVSKELKLPDPKVLLRCTADMPEDLLELAIDCISTGIGAPLLSNDDVVIPAMVSCGYDEADAYNYGTAACWEPLIPGLSCDANNIASLDFAIPLVELFESESFVKSDSIERIVGLYTDELKKHIRDLLTPLTKLEFEEDPLLSLLSVSSLERKKDITRGGAKYYNFGLTSVGLGCVVNSLLNIKKLVFDENRYSLFELNEKRHNNFAGDDALVTELKDLYPAYGSDDDYVIRLTKYLMSVTSTEFSKYSTKYGGKFKVGLSSPNYISGAGKIPATLDGRKQGEPFSVHISSSKAIPTTELLSFAMKLDYNDNRLNGNVVDFFTTPSFIKQNMHKFASLLRSSFSGGIFQLQMNVVDSKTLIAAKADPKLFPELVVRVWGFSAYFNDLPEEYKDVLIARAIESEKVA